MPTSAPVPGNQNQKLHHVILSARARLGLTCSLIVAILLLVQASGAQQQTQTQTETTPPAPSANQQGQSTTAAVMMAPVQSGAEMFSFLARKSRLFPNLAMNPGPLSPEEKFKLAANNSLALSSWIAAGLSAGINQAYDSPAGYGQGAEGYGKRYGAAMARRASSQVFGTFLLASALHQDPRFFVRSDLNLGGSIKYSIRRVFITRSDTGKHVFNWSGLLGMLMSEGLANAYYPDNFRTAGNTFSRFGYDLLGNAGGNLLRQYWPRINHKLKLAPPPTGPVGGSSSGATKP